MIITTIIIFHITGDGDFGSKSRERKRAIIIYLLGKTLAIELYLKFCHYQSISKAYMLFCRKSGYLNIYALCVLFLVIKSEWC